VTYLEGNEVLSARVMYAEEINVDQVVAAAPGYSVVEMCEDEVLLHPVIAWSICDKVAQPVCVDSNLMHNHQFAVLEPSGRVIVGAGDCIYDSLDAYRRARIAEMLAEGFPVGMSRVPDPPMSQAS
jgi:hypothetical protein